MESEISEIVDLPSLISYIDTNMAAQQIDYVGVMLPKEFIAPAIAQLLQGQHLQLAANQASSSSSNDAFAFNELNMLNPVPVIAIIDPSNHP